MLLLLLLAMPFIATGSVVSVLIIVIGNHTGRPHT